MYSFLLNQPMASFQGACKGGLKGGKDPWGGYGAPWRKNKWIGNPGKALFYPQENGCPINFHVMKSNEISRSMSDLRLNHVESYPDGLQTVALKDDFLFYMNGRIS
jgi:hypothetical protein